jgi:hypothetical protein
MLDAMRHVHHLRHDHGVLVIFDGLTRNVSFSLHPPPVIALVAFDERTGSQCRLP